jgi:hypothetical protein
MIEEKIFFRKKLIQKSRWKRKISRSNLEKSGGVDTK